MAKLDDSQKSVTYMDINNLLTNISALADDCINKGKQVTTQQLSTYFTNDATWTYDNNVTKSTENIAKLWNTNHANLKYGRHNYTSRKIIIANDGLNATGKWALLGVFTNKENAELIASGLYEGNFQYNNKNKAWLATSIKYKSDFFSSKNDGWVKATGQLWEENVEKEDDEKKELVVTRREIRSLNDKEQDRFWKAVYQMMKNKNGVAGTSEYFRIASYHGGPGESYCSHGIETFPTWHRIYLKEFENALQAADKALGNDGNVFLPYWDWSLKQEDGLPEIVVKNFSQFPKDLFPANTKNAPSLKRNSTKNITRYLQSYNVSKDASGCLLATQHWAHASTGHEDESFYPSIEKPHNSVHVVVGGNGGPMSSVAWAAFDIAFWLHHCNIDRVYEGYLKLEPDSSQEFENYQNIQKEDLYDLPFEPFKKKDGSKYYPKDCFIVKNLGYDYDVIPKANNANANALIEPPTMVVFPDLKITKFASKCYMIHIFLLKKGKEDDFKAPKDSDDVIEHNNYAGSGAIFGRGKECENCEKRLPFDLTIDVTDFLKKHKLSRHNIVIKGYASDTTQDDDVLIPIEETPLTKPRLSGPLFEENESMLDVKKRGELNSEEVKSLQKWLKRYGYYDDDVDGDYGPITESAVKTFQFATGDLKVDGLAGPKTKNAIINKKRCDNIDAFGNNKIKDEESLRAINLVNENKKKINYWVGIQPGYLKRKDVLKCIDKAFDKWEKASSLKFKHVNDKTIADIKLEWTNGAKGGNLLKFDGPGGVLGRGGAGYVQFDISERWVINGKYSDLTDQSTWIRGSPAIDLNYTVLHEIGHALGLEHSNDAKDLMSPFYNPKTTELSKNDIDRIKKLYG